jgi:hypothetical protein
VEDVLVERYLDVERVIGEGNEVVEFVVDVQGGDVVVDMVGYKSETLHQGVLHKIDFETRLKRQRALLRYTVCSTGTLTIFRDSQNAAQISWSMYSSMYPCTIAAVTFSPLILHFSIPTTYDQPQD